MRGHQSHTHTMEQAADCPPPLPWNMITFWSKEMESGQGLWSTFWTLCFALENFSRTHSSLQNCVLVWRTWHLSPSVTILNFDARMRISDGQNILLPHIVTKVNKYPAQLLRPRDWISFPWFVPIIPPFCTWPFFLAVPPSSWFLEFHRQWRKRSWAILVLWDFVGMWQTCHLVLLCKELLCPNSHGVFPGVPGKLKWVFISTCYHQSCG